MCVCVCVSELSCVCVSELSGVSVCVCVLPQDRCANTLNVFSEVKMMTLRGLTDHKLFYGRLSRLKH